MLVVGAGGHALEVLELIRGEISTEELSFFDNYSIKGATEFYGYPILKSYKEVKDLFQYNNEFILALGGSANRFNLSEKFLALGGDLHSIISGKAIVSEKSIIGKGVNIMPFSAIFGNAIVQEGVLINAFSSIHHDSIIGRYSELSPGCRILGGCKIGDFCEIGSNAVILPKVQITSEVIIGAGSVVTTDINEKGVYVGSPATKIK